MTIDMGEDRLKWVILLSEAIYSRCWNAFRNSYWYGKMVGNSLIAMDINILHDWYYEGEL